MGRRQRKKNKMEKYCDNCKVSYPDNISYCPKCGKLLIEKKYRRKRKNKICTAIFTTNSFRFIGLGTGGMCRGNR